MSNDNHWAFEPNPLLEHLPDIDDMNDFVAKLAFHPMDGMDLQSLSLPDRMAFLTAGKMPLEPTTQSIRTALTCFGMLRGSLINRNPVRNENRRSYWMKLQNDKTIAKLIQPAPLTGASALVIKGPTGTGKTVTVQRLCNLLPQVILHGENRDAGWGAMSQLVYLYTQLPANGSRGAFLNQILSDMDDALGTKYELDIPRRYRAVEERAVAVVSRLVVHYTGILFIDECQLRNLILSGQADVMQIFLLSLMNTGIPIVLIGNELAFDWIDFSQDLSRMNTVPKEYFHPIGALTGLTTEIDWHALYTGISRYYVMPSPIRDPQKCSVVLRQCSGGIGRLALTLWTNAQSNRLYEGGIDIGPEDILAAYNRPNFDELRPLAAGFHRKDPVLLERYSDVDIAYYRTIWKNPKQTSSQQGPTTRHPQAESTSTTDKKEKRKQKPRSGAAAIEAELTRKKNQQKQRNELKETLPQDDLRHGIVGVHLKGLEAMRRQSSETEQQDNVTEEDV